VDALSVPTDTRVLVAVSGGPDSVALVHAFHRISQRPGNRLTLRLAHVNHSLRGTESDEDEAFVRALASRLDLEVDVVRVETAAYAAEQRQSTEAAARELRYAVLRRMLRAWSGDLIAVGHNRDDQSETILMNLLRGSGLAGLSGMSERSLDIVRPFLHLSREAIGHALTTVGETYRTDSSNADLRPRRNLLRNTVLPTLEGIHPGVGATIARTAFVLGHDAAYLQTEAEVALQYMDTRFLTRYVSAHAGVFRALHHAVQGRVLRLLVSHVQGHANDLTEGHVLVMREAIVADGPERSIGSRLPHRLQLQAGGDRFHLFQGEWEEAPPLPPVILPIPGNIETALGHFRATILSQDLHHTLPHQFIVCGPHHAFCDADVLGNQVIVRTRRPGDRLSFTHAPGTKKLQDLLVDAKIPRRERDRIPVLETAEFIAWVPGFGVDRRASAGPDTKAVAHVQFRSFL
jgi:tRNA(Ile)-lysidine synthase